MNPFCDIKRHLNSLILTVHVAFGNISERNAI